MGVILVLNKSLYRYIRPVIMLVTGRIFSYFLFANIIENY